MSKSIYSSSSLGAPAREIHFVQYPWLAIFISPAQVYLSLFNYDPYKGRFRLYICWGIIFACMKSDMINSTGSSHFLSWQIAVLVIAAAVSAWAGVNLYALNVFAGFKLFNVALDFEKLKIIALWSILPQFIASIVAEGGLAHFPLLQLLVLLAGALYSAAIFFSGVSLFCDQIYKVILAPLIFPLLVAAIVLVVT